MQAQHNNNDFVVRSLKSLLQSNKLVLIFFVLVISTFILIFFNYQMDAEISATTTETKKNVYSVWAIPTESVTERLKKLMVNLRSEFGGPEFEPHVTVVGAIQLTESDAIHKFNLACQGVKPYTATVNSVSTGTFFYQCVYLLLHPSNEVLETSAHCSRHFGYLSSSPYMPHASLLYGDLTEEQKQRAKQKAEAFDAGVSSLSFQISCLALYKTDTEDKTLKSWEKIADCDLV